MSRSLKESFAASTASPLEGKVIKATDSSMDVPKAKHLEAILLFTHLPDYNQGKIVDALLARSKHHSAVVVLKALIVFHRLLRDGHERFSQYLVTSTTFFDLEAFVDSSTPDALSMSGFIQAYAAYIELKIATYRQLGFDVCHVNASDHIARMRRDSPPQICENLRIFIKKAHQLLLCVSEKAPETGVQLHAQAHGSFAVEIKFPPAMLFSNNCIKGATKLLLKDMLKVFVVLNENVVSMLEAYFKMQKKDASDSLALYEEFVGVCEQLDVFFNKCKNGQILDGRNIPELTAAPKVLLPAMRQYLENYGARRQTAEEADTVAQQLSHVRLGGVSVSEEEASEA
eukprot:m.239925 g.239925  ORF g.239925 m.239925 type:complete len:343 (+) comp13571_c0_seq1:40-1068(+)